MQPETLQKHWSTVRADLYQAMDSLTDEQLTFTPRQGLWSLHETICHIASTEEGWFRYIVLHEINGWNEAEFLPADYPTIASLKELLARVHARTEAMFAPDIAAVMKRAVSTSWGLETDVEWVTWHVIEHEIHHRGEIYLMLGMLGIEAPDV
jgi:uncharacterized damage-inducible protein DinB